MCVCVCVCVCVYTCVAESGSVTSASVPGSEEADVDTCPCMRRPPDLKVGLLCSRRGLGASLHGLHGAFSGSRQEKGQLWPGSKWKHIVL